MSLLNDALRDLERRSGDDAATQATIPAGLRAGPAPRRKTASVVAVGTVFLGLAAGAYLGVEILRVPDPIIPAQTDVSVGPPVSELAADKTGVDPLSGSEPLAPAVAPAESRVPSPVLAEESLATTAPAEIVPPEITGEAAPESAPEKALPEPSAIAGAGNANPAPRPDSVELRSATVAERNVAPMTEPARLTPASQPLETLTVEAEKIGTASSDPVKQLPQTAQARDRRLAPTLERMLIEGREGEAERLLEAAVATGAHMPQSHATLARYYLAQKRIAEARRWLPAALVAREPQLRLLQGRLVLLEQGPEAALAVLAEGAPSPAESPEYASTLAALYQQTGQYARAGQQWVALLELDSQRPDRWLGLALALDGQNQVGGALTAYREALALPNLAPRLRAFAQARIDALTLN